MSARRPRAASRTRPGLLSGLGCHIVRQREDALDERALSAAAHDFGAQAISEERAHGVDQDRLAGAGLARDDVETSVPLDLRTIDDGENYGSIADLALYR